MSWTCRLVPAPGNGTAYTDLRVGDMWLAPYLLAPRGGEEDGSGYHPFRAMLSPKYWRDHAAKRAPLVVRLPGPVDFMIDSMAWHIEEQPDGTARRVYDGEGWYVSGDAPLITVAPSINISGIYHGYLQGGVITDDCEGRRFDADGRAMR